MKKSRPGKKKRLSPRTVKAAKMAASGKTQAQIAQVLGVSQPAVSQMVATVRRLEIDYEDVRDSRLNSARRLDEYRRRLLAIAGVRDHEDPDARQPPPQPKATADRLVTDAEWDEYKTRCIAMGFDIDGFPQTFAEPAQQVSALRALVQVEQRRARLFGLDAPKLIAQVTAKSVRSMSEEELVEEMRQMGLEPPPGLTEALRAQIKDPTASRPHPVVGPEAAAIGLRPHPG
jgi:hypothetical protein